MEGFVILYLSVLSGCGEQTLFPSHAVLAGHPAAYNPIQDEIGPFYASIGVKGLTKKRRSHKTRLFSKEESVWHRKKKSF
ncbi:hypothetical protein HMPREF9374_1660 [Desmospora sp. 8437]|nr:hypothetical protein HMPREF9374_1660 [Desmospora sp. 8437]